MEFQIKIKFSLLSSKLPLGPKTYHQRPSSQNILRWIFNIEWNHLISCAFGHLPTTYDSNLVANKQSDNLSFTFSDSLLQSVS